PRVDRRNLLAQRRLAVRDLVHRRHRVRRLDGVRCAASQGTRVCDERRQCVGDDDRRRACALSGLHQLVLVPAALCGEPPRRLLDRGSMPKKTTKKAARKAGRAKPAKRAAKRTAKAAGDALLATVRGATHRYVGHVRLDVGRAGAARVKRMIYPPGFHWAKDMKPVTGTELCMHAHVGFLARGEIHIEYADGCVV